MVQTVKNLPTVQETQVRSLGWEDPPEKRIENTATFQRYLKVNNPPAIAASFGVELWDHNSS